MSTSALALQPAVAANSANVSQLTAGDIGDLAHFQLLHTLALHHDALLGIG